MIMADLAKIAGRTYPAGRRTQNLAGGASPIQARGFCMGYVTLEPGGGQVPWHNHDQEEVYFIVQGTGEACVGGERTTLSAGQAIYVPPDSFPPAHQPRSRAAGHDVRVLARRGRRSLAPGAGRHPAPGRTGSAAAARGGAAPARGEGRMTTRSVGIIMNGVTGRMGMNQHLLRSIVPIIRQGGVRAGKDTVIVPEPLLVGRSAEKLEAAARAAGLSRWTTDLDAALSDPGMSVYFDAQTTLQRAKRRHQGHPGRQARLLRETHGHQHA